MSVKVKHMDAWHTGKMEQKLFSSPITRSDHEYATRSFEQVLQRSLVQLYQDLASVCSVLLRTGVVGHVRVQRDGIQRALVYDQVKCTLWKHGLHIGQFQKIQSVKCHAVLPLKQDRARRAGQGHGCF